VSAGNLSQLGQIVMPQLRVRWTHAFKCECWLAGNLACKILARLAKGRDDETELEP